MKMNPVSILYRIILAVLLLVPASLQAQVPVHEIRIYTFPTMYPIHWDNPAILYKTAKRCFYRTAALKDNYLLGHMVLSLNSPLLPQKRYLAMTAANKMQRVDLILKEKIGLAILGATLEGKLESEEHIQHMLQVYTKRQKTAFISFLVSEDAMKRMLDFVEQFSRVVPGQVQPSRYYGGFYWPLYEDEGAGCSAFALGVLSAAGILPDEAGQWLKNVNIPMSLIGGEYRGNKRIPFGRILRTKAWYEGTGKPNVDYVNVQTYDPSMMFDWILQQRFRNDSAFVPVLLDDVPGLLVDCTTKPLPAEKPYFVKRQAPNLFLDIYHKKIKKDVTQPTP